MLSMLVAGVGVGVGAVGCVLKSLSEITLGAQQFYPRNAQCAVQRPSPRRAWQCTKMLAKSFWPTQMRKIFENSKVTLR